MRVLIVGDIHFGKVVNGISLDKEVLRVCNYILDIAIQRGVDTVVILGDFFDSVYPKFSTLDEVERLWDRVSVEANQYRIIILSGNHDKLNNGYSSLLYHLTKNISNIKIIQNATSEGPFNFYPYHYDKETFREVVNNGNTYNFAHIEMKEKYNFKKIYDISMDDFNGQLFMGHFHSPDIPGENKYILGSICDLEFSSEPIERSVLILDTDTNKLEKIVITGAALVELTYKVQDIKELSGELLLRELNIREHDERIFKINLDVDSVEDGNVFKRIRKELDELGVKCKVAIRHSGIVNQDKLVKNNYHTFLKLTPRELLEKYINSAYCGDKRFDIIKEKALRAYDQIESQQG